MLRPIRLNPRLRDPIQLQQVAKYQGNLTVTSNDTNIIPRDEAGNIQLQEGSETNPLLIIEPVATRITLNSVLKVLDTQFQYFKFPATVRIIDDTDVDIDLTIPELDEDTISTELKLPVAIDSNGQPISFVKINTSYVSDWFYDGEQNSSGFAELPFEGEFQTKPNSYTVTQTTIDTLQKLNKTLRFTIQTEFVSSVSNLTGFSIKLKRTNPKAYRLFQSPELSTTSKGTENTYPQLFMQYIVDTNDLIEGDSYTIEAVSGNPAYSKNENAYWQIDIVDIPNIPPILGTNNNSGVYNIYGASRPVRLFTINFSNNERYEVGGKIPGSNEFIYYSNDYKNTIEQYD